MSGLTSLAPPKVQAPLLPNSQLCTTVNSVVQHLVYCQNPQMPPWLQKVDLHGWQGHEYILVWEGTKRLFPAEGCQQAAIKVLFESKNDIGHHVFAGLRVVTERKLPVKAGTTSIHDDLADTGCRWRVVEISFSRNSTTGGRVETLQKPSDK